MTTAEREERARLEVCRQKIGANLARVNARLAAAAKEIQEIRDHMGEARRDLDHLDKVALRQIVDQKSREAEVLRQRQQKLLKLQKSPYFGRIDFVREGETEAEPIYVGVHDGRDEATGETLVYDWRAPIASMFYDHELGTASYRAPSGEIRGRLELKRQFRIRDGRLEYMFDTSVNIVDEILQKELSRSSDDGLKTIVATIQRDQNAIVRDAEAHTLVIQGVAGSGKTSIALHRIAFLLYRFKDTLRSQDILIVSPNRVFADYIGNILPELGEERVEEIGMEALADALLEGKVRFETFFEQTARLLERDDEALAARIAAKSSLAFLEQVDAYADHLLESSFTASEWRTGQAIVPAWHFEETWRKQRERPLKQRVAEVVAATEHQFYRHYRRELEPEEKRRLREAVRGMVRRTALRPAYKGLFDWLGRPELFAPIGGKLEYADVFPLVHLKMRLEGIENPFANVKHLLIDEMQDYTPVQYAVIGKLFPCRKTILGDAGQALSPLGGTTAAQIRDILRAAAPVKLTKSYRSTYEIMRFALEIAPDAELVPMKRHGDPVELLLCHRPEELVDRLGQEVEAFAASDHRSLAIIAKTERQASELHRRLARAGIAARLLDAAATGFSTGILVCPVYLAKGLEFDRVVVADASRRNFASELDRRLLYVACTRAMHRLVLIAVGEPSPLLPARAEAREAATTA